MKQSDHQRRIDQQRKDKAEQQHMAGIGSPEAETGESDYVVLVLLIGSAVLLALAASRRLRVRSRW